MSHRFSIPFLSPLLVLVATGSLLAMESNSRQEKSVLGREVRVRWALSDGRPGPVQTVATVVKTPSEWLRQLGKERYEVLRNQGTEPAFCGNLVDHHDSGIYFCAGCDLPLFTSVFKFNSKTGWPSFFKPFAKENVWERSDTNHGMVRTEILCARCGGHLGHVFPDGPPPTGLRYCLNSQALVFRAYSEIPIK